MDSIESKSQVFDPPEEEIGNEENLTVMKKAKLFLSTHWRGIVILVWPVVSLSILLPLPPENYQCCAYTVIVMTVFWVTEAIPLAVTSFMPVIIFPLAGLMSTDETLSYYFNDTVLMFIASLFLASSVEQSGLHQRLALNIIYLIGYSHKRLLLALSFTTMFVSFWITNTAATTMMIPVNFAILQIFENQKTLTVFEVDEKTGDKIATDISTCYFCAATFSATIGGIGTLVGTATNLGLKGLFMSEFPTAPEYLTFPLFSAFSIPYCIVLEICCYFCLAIQYLGLFRPKSKEAQETTLSEDDIKAIREAIYTEREKLGKISYREIVVAILFSGAMIGFFLRSPKMFTGWGDKIQQDLNLGDKYIQDSAWAYFVVAVMMLLPCSLQFFYYFKPSVPSEELPMKPIPSILDWNSLASITPFSFAFLLGGGFALAEAAKLGFNNKIGQLLSSFRNQPNNLILFYLIVFTIIVTNFASNLAVCNVIAPIAMALAVEIDKNPLHYATAVGFSASYCFILPVGTPGNIIAQSAASIPTPKMIKAGIPVTICTCIITWIAFCYWAPVIWPDILVHNPSSQLDWILHNKPNIAAINKTVV